MQYIAQKRTKITLFCNKMKNIDYKRIEKDYMTKYICDRKTHWGIVENNS